MNDNEEELMGCGHSVLEDDVCGGCYREIKEELKEAEESIYDRRKDFEDALFLLGKLVSFADDPQWLSTSGKGRAVKMQQRAQDFVAKFKANQ